MHALVYYVAAYSWAGLEGVHCTFKYFLWHSLPSVYGPLIW